MPIYARNSLGSDMKITANENYSYADMGRILSECVQNDQILFNAVMRNDFKESTAIREGTMVSSELAAFREASAKDAWESLKARLKKLWEKIKGVFRQVYAKLTVWFVRYGKAFVAANRAVLANKKLDGCKIPLYLKEKKSPADLHSKVCEEAIKKIKEVGTSAENETTEEEVNSVLGKAVSGATAENFGEKFHSAVFDEEKDQTYKTLGLKTEVLFAEITGKGSAMKELKEAEKKVDTAVKAAMSAIKAARGSAEKDADKGNFGTASRNVGAFERTVTISSRAAIKAVRDKVANRRQIVGKLVAYNPNSSNPTSESAMLETMAWFEGADDFAAVDDIPAEEIKADDVQSDPDVEINVTVDDDGNECSK